MQQGEKERRDAGAYSEREGDAEEDAVREPSRGSCCSPAAPHNSRFSQAMPAACSAQVMRKPHPARGAEPREGQRQRQVGFSGTRSSEEQENIAAGRDAE